MKFIPAQLISFFFFLFALTSLISISNARDHHHQNFKLGKENLVGSWTKGLLQFAQAPSPGYDVSSRPAGTLVLAAKRTNRPDVLSGFKRYKDGWDIRNRHYWASVGFTGSAGFILAALWFFCFGVALVMHHCCRWTISMKGECSSTPHRICLILLLILTCAAAIGCILLSVGQDEFHGEALHTLNYVVYQSEYVVQTLRNVTEYLSLAKSTNIDQVFLPSNVKDEIDKLNVDLNAAANTLTEKTSENSGRIRKAFNAVRSSLITMAALMLLLALLGLLLSMLGHQHAIYIFIWSGWLLVAVTFILCGVFVVLNSAVSDTCLAMGEWVENPHAETALSDILPCVDQGTTNKTLIQSKEVINQLVTLVNTVIYSFADWNPTPQDGSVYHNQSGPLMPPLCSPFDSQLHDRTCAPQEVSFSNASLVWQNYTCEVNEYDICTTVGRITPSMYTQLVSAVNVSYALEHYTPPLLSLQDCNFVRETFGNITSNYCPPLKRYLKMVNAGLHFKRALSDNEKDSLILLMDRVASCRLHNGRDDEISWSLEAKGVFTTKSLFEFWNRRDVNDFPARTIWKAGAPARISFFVWTAALAKISTFDMLRKKGQIWVSVCLFCKRTSESSNHLLLQCSFAKGIWNHFMELFNVAWVFNETVLDLIKSWRGIGGTTRGRILWKLIPHAVLWGLWIERNNRTYAGKERGREMVINDIKTLLWSWTLHMPAFKGFFLDQFIVNWEAVINL